ncbi:serine acetyltransferase [Chlorobium sp. BLA1]|uniref:serine O-acetyltransferase EpsC n=1 Tax=Candidatus Chlorobium masyuteum TaxID=2716876 RepID=UPI0014212FDE|nr:serine O-acetyltransferase EpsC [Candidatus Chlorobium masyuteum]NHQ60198.1 serine acetyltransferase [Candidatus Chlorobium masyuteum]NTU44539.1 serine acetyltransferase [Chlorobiaceae bacterium]
METKSSSIIENTIQLLAVSGGAACDFLPDHERLHPSIEKLKAIVELLRSILFPGYFGEPIQRQNSLPHILGVRVEKLYLLLAEQIRSVQQFNHENNHTADSGENSEGVAEQFIGILPEIRRKLCTDVRAIFDGDPAAKNYGEIIFCYPSIRAMINYRAAHTLLSLGVPLIPRIISEMSHSETGIDIHPGAHIGEYFCIDHGTGVVIGETCIIGNHVRLYQGVTLGAKKFTLDNDGNPAKNVPRHPIIEDNVVIYSNANVLGRITIGKNSIIGGNVWQTKSLPPNSRVLQQKAVESSFTDGGGI